jgi:hypothetical protein
VNMKRIQAGKAHRQVNAQLQSQVAALIAQVLGLYGWLLQIGAARRST